VLSPKVRAPVRPAAGAENLIEERKDNRISRVDHMSAANDRVSGPGDEPGQLLVNRRSVAHERTTEFVGQTPPRLVAEHETGEPLGGRVWSTVGFGLINGSTQPSVVAGL